MHLYPCNDALYFLDNGWVFSKWNTMSNLAYVIMGMLGMIQTHMYMQRKCTQQHLTQHRDEFSHKVVASWYIMFLYAWIVTIGFVSTIYHSTLTQWSICMDFMSIKLFILFIGWGIGHQRVARFRLFFTIGAIVLLSSTGILIICSQFYPSVQSAISLTYFILVSLFIVVTYVGIGYVVYLAKPKQKGTTYNDKIKQRVLTREYHRARYHFTMSTVLFTVSLICYFVPYVGCNAYRFTSWGPYLQMHSFWHILSAISLYYCVKTVSYLHSKK